MSKILITFIIIFSLLLSAFAYIILALRDDNTSFQTPFTSKPTPTNTVMTSLTLVPEDITVIKEQSNTINIILDGQNTNAHKTKLIQMEIAYDPKALLDVEITPGGFFVNPIIPLLVINTHSGRISYALLINENESTQYTTSSVVARLTFLPNPAFTGPETSLSFMGKTMIRDTADTNILTATYGTKLIFASGSATPQITQ